MQKFLSLRGDFHRTSFFLAGDLYMRCGRGRHACHAMRPGHPYIVVSAGCTGPLDAVRVSRDVLADAAG